jgi:TRAP-type transport system periplasmic protein
MSCRISRRAFVGATAATLVSPAILHAAEPIKIRCSLDTAPSHPRNVAVLDYLAKLAKESNGEIVGEVFHSGQLFADLNVSKALLQGQVEMAVPGGWVMTGLVSDCDMAQLPYFYGIPIEVTHKATNGKAGAYVSAQLAEKLKTQILGPWIDLGYQNWYSTKVPLDKFSAMKGLKIRSPGGAGISWRIKFAGGIANTTAWPNVPLALSQGTFDAFISSDESCNSAKLWEAGVKYSYVDHQFLAQYVPMIGKPTWERLSPAQRTLMTDLWAANVESYNKGAAASQANARGILEKNGVKFYDPPANELATTRAAMIDDLATLVKDSKLSPEIVKLVKDSV